MRRAAAGFFAVAMLSFALSASAGEVVLNAVDQGWYARDLGPNFADGEHTASNENTLTGRATNSRDHRSFFAFDLSAETEPVSAAELRLALGNYSGGSPSGFTTSPRARQS